MGRNSKWPRGFYSCLAGFVDQSESLEQAVAREVLEESSIVIRPASVAYVSSQPWPFPCQLMIGAALHSLRIHPLDQSEPVHPPRTGKPSYCALIPRADWSK